MASGEASTEPDATSALTPLIESLHRFAHPHHTLDLHKEKKRKNKMRLLNLMRANYNTKLPKHLTCTITLTVSKGAGEVVIAR